MDIFTENFQDWIDEAFKVLGLDDKQSAKEEKKHCNKEPCKCKFASLKEDNLVQLFNYDEKSDYFHIHFDEESYRLDVVVTGFPTTAIEVKVDPDTRILSIRSDRNKHNVCHAESVLVKDVSYDFQLPENIDYRSFDRECVDGLLTIKAKKKKEQPKLEPFSI